MLGETGEPLTHVFEVLSRVFFRIVGDRDDRRADRRVRRDGVHDRRLRAGARCCRSGG